MRREDFTVSDLYFLTDGVDFGYPDGDFEGSIHDGLSEGIYEFDLPSGETARNMKLKSI